MPENGNGQASISPEGIAYMPAGTLVLAAGVTGRSTMTQARMSAIVRLAEGTAAKEPDMPIVHIDSKYGKLPAYSITSGGIVTDQALLSDEEEFEAHGHEAH